MSEIPPPAGHAAGTAASGGQIRRLSAGLPVPESSTVRLKTDGIFQLRTVQKIYKIRERVMSFKDIFKKSFLEGFCLHGDHHADGGHGTGRGVLLALYILFRLSGRDPKDLLFQELQYHAGRRHRDHGVAHSHHAIQRGAVAGHGGRAVHRPLPYRYQEADGSDVPVLWSISVGIILRRGTCQVAVILSG